MPVETTADIAALFDADEFAEAAVYQSPNPGADPVPCLVIYDRGQGRSRFRAGEREGVGGNRHLWALAGDGPQRAGDSDPAAPQLLPDIKRGARFTITADGEVIEVAGLSKLDETGHLWSVELNTLD